MSYKRFVYVTAASAPPETSCATPASASQTLHVCAFGFGPAHGMSERTYVRTSYVSTYVISSTRKEPHQIASGGEGGPRKGCSLAGKLGDRSCQGGAASSSRCQRQGTSLAPPLARRPGPATSLSRITPRPTVRTSWASASWPTTSVVMDAGTLGK